MQECILDIQLMDWPLARGDKAEDDTNCGGLDDGAERLVVVDAGTLGVTAYDLTVLVSCKAAVEVIMLEDPFASDDISAGWTWNKSPCAIVHERTVIVGHCSVPVGVGEGAATIEAKPTVGSRLTHTNQTRRYLETMEKEPNFCPGSISTTRL